MPDSDDDWKEFDKDKEAFVRKLRAAWRSDPRDLDAKAKYRRFKSILDLLTEPPKRKPRV